MTVKMFYGPFGHCSSKEQDTSCAYSTENGYRYILFNRQGTPYDYWDVSHRMNRAKRDMGVPVWDWRSVKEEIFTEYISYLSDSNKAHLRNVVKGLT